MIPQYKDTLATKEILSLDYIPLVLAILLHKKAIQHEVSPIEQFAYHCEALSLLEKSREERPHFFLATLASCLLYYQLGCPNEAFHCYGNNRRRYLINRAIISKRDSNHVYVLFN